MSLPPDETELWAIARQHKCMNVVNGRLLDGTSYIKKFRKGCPICNVDSVWPMGSRWKFESLDKYQRQVLSEKDYHKRSWGTCTHCKLIRQTGHLTHEQARKLYSNGYRSEEFRGETVKEAFFRIRGGGHSENLARVDWILAHVHPSSLLDIGSGLGLFPDEMRSRIEGLHVQCFEPNTESSDFINDKLHIPCQNTEYHPAVFKRQYDLVSLVHVLEHIHNPREFMAQVGMDLAKHGKVYIEVPDACEFEYLEPDADDFNSTHVTFFDLAHLSMFLESCNYKIMASKVVRTERNLTRLMVLAERYRPWLMNKGN